MHRVWGVLAVFALLPLNALAQGAATDEREQEMQEMRARIERLEKLVVQLQKETGSGIATAPAAGDGCLQPCPVVKRRVPIVDWRVIPAKR